MKDLFTHFSDGRMSPSERQIRAIEGIWKSLDRIDNSLSKIALKDIDEMIAHDLSNAINASIDAQAEQQQSDLSQVPVSRWSKEQMEEVCNRLRNRTRRTDIAKDETLRRLVIYRWNIYCDEYQKYLRKEIRYAPKKTDWAMEIGLIKTKKNNDLKRLLCSTSTIMTADQYNQREKIEE